MSAYENVIVGRLKLKGKALDVKSGGIKKKKHKKLRDHAFQVTQNDQTDNLYENGIETANEQADKHDSHLTPAERRYLEQWEKINIRRLAKEAAKSHRDRIQEFNQYLANLSEHYDIPKNIPKAFLAKYLKGQGPNLAILRRGDRSWWVKINGQMLADGWEKFAAENGLHVGDFVVFRHEGDKVFDITVFEPSYYEREYQLPISSCSVPQSFKNLADLNQKPAPAVVEGSVPEL